MQKTKIDWKFEYNSIYQRTMDFIENIMNDLSGEEHIDLPECCEYYRTVLHNENYDLREEK